MESFGKRHQRLRDIKNYSQSDVAKIIGVSPSTYRKWELGREIKGEPYEKLAVLLEVTISELLTGRRPEVGVYLEQIEKAVKSMRGLL